MTVMQSGMWVDEGGFVWWGEFRLPLRVIVVEEGTATIDALEFFDKDKRRSADRGSRTVAVPLAEFNNLISHTPKMD